jgi:hypothetical protein
VAVVRADALVVEWAAGRHGVITTARLAAGYRVLRVTWRELTEAPDAVVATLASALSRG